MPLWENCLLWSCILQGLLILFSLHFSCLPKVSLTTVAELYNGDDHTVNRHGFQRNVKEEENAIETKVGAHLFMANRQIMKYALYYEASS